MLKYVFGSFVFLERTTRNVRYQVSVSYLEIYQEKLRDLLVPDKPSGKDEKGTITLLIAWSTSELNGQLNPTTCLGDTDCWIQQVTAPTLVVTCWIQQSTCILPPVGQGGLRPPVQVDDKMHVECWIQQVTTELVQ